MAYASAHCSVLVPHPDSAGGGAAIAVEARLTAPGLLVCDYALHADMRHVRLPDSQGGARTDELWRHTCFEAFVTAADVVGYYEFNFSPARDWAAYCFEHYRHGMSAALLAAAPRLQVHSAPARLDLSATLDLAGLADLTAAARLRVALAAVIEDDSGQLSYWSLQHAPGKPDFHHPDGFTLELSPP
jgi:hypothetical protein